MKSLENFDKQMADQLRAELASECSKPSDEWDLDKIRELSKVICDIEGISPDSEGAASGRKRALDRIGAEKPIIRRRRIKRFTAAAACLAVAFVGADLTSRQVLGQGVLPAGYHAVMGGIITYLDGSDGTPDPHENIYYDLMKEKIDEYGLDVMIPTYIPKGFELEQVVEENTGVIFCFINDQKRVNIAYHQINDLNRVGSFGIPTDTREVYETDVNGHQFYTIKEDQQLKAWCIERESITQLDTYEMSYVMADEVLYSLE
ncbi:MAG TPA: hypothetical protein DCZ62_03280 [Ruminococcus sp.]|nr:hypothetical protein [Ruminococcus sp.]